MRLKLSLSNQLLIFGLALGTMIPLLGYFSEIRSRDVGKINHQIREVSNQNLEKSKLLGEMIFKFRTIRIEVRSIPLRGMTNAQIDRQIDLTKQAVASFQESVKKYATHIASENENENRIYQELNKNFADFLSFGVELIKMSSAYEAKSLDEVSRLVQVVCPEKASLVEKSIQELIQAQSDETKQLVQKAELIEKKASQMILIGSILGFILASFLSYFIGRRISSSFQQLVNELVKTSQEVGSTSIRISENGNSVANGVSSQASAIQQTVSAIDQISSMIEKNAENAENSQNLASKTLGQTEEGKQMIDEVVNQLAEMQRGTADLIKAVEAGNHKISKIVDMISEIEAKTKVINEIVFQTKLLSFNASVEAARAGEAGKGFAVVAEEVGGLAAMSGKASREISDLLSESVRQVKSIIVETQKVLEERASRSLAIVDQGHALGVKCGESFGAILVGTNEVTTKVHEISEASKEQSSGVNEVTKAIHRMDQATQENASVAESLKGSAQQLNSQAEVLNSIVNRIVLAIQGEKKSRNSVADLGRDETRQDKQDNSNQSVAA